MQAKYSAFTRAEGQARLARARRPVVHQSVEGPHREASRRWATTDEFHPLSGGRRPQSAIRD